MSGKIAIQICGTGSGVGKSVIVSALCRIFLQDGYKVCPFKAQNMALNSYVTEDGGEIGRAQAVQAQACRIEPSVDMNPVLIKPTSDVGAQIIVQGKPISNMNAQEYTKYKNRLLGTVRKSFSRLAKEYEIMVMEGAGSPAEVNLKRHDIVNMKMAEYAKAPVILVGDIDKGGVFAWLIGTLDLLTQKERNLVKGIIINKFRGDKKLLKDGIGFLERKTKKPVVGVVPYFKDIRIPEEDSVVLENKIRTTYNAQRTTKLIDIAVIKLPHISNFTDFDALENEPDVKLRYVTAKCELDNPDVIIIPGTKNTIGDLIWLKQSGLADKILTTYNLQLTTTLIGICGGYQMLGEKIYDRHKTESRKKEIAGLGVLPIVTNFEKEKILSQVKAQDLNSGLKVTGYEIHHGRTKILKECKSVFKIVERQGKIIEDFDGALVENGRIWGTYIHGVFDEDNFRRNFLNRLRLNKGWSSLVQTANFNLDKEFDKLAKLVRENINMNLVYRILNHGL